MTRWFEHTSDPNTPAIVALRARQIELARREPVARRVDYLAELAAGRRVLDVGMVEHSMEIAQQAGWLHGRLAAAASYCLGIDILEGPIEALRSEGYNVKVCDITKDKLEDTFEVIVAGEVIEHLDEPAALFRAAARLLTPDGRLVVTTPNPFAIHRAWQGLRGQFKDSVDHVAMFSASNIVELAERADLVLLSWRGVRLKTMSTPRGRAQAGVRRALLSGGFSPESACDTLIFECGRPIPS